ncbi:hypothetical protein ACWOAH_04620 [Vagococcus vulneris]|uniref:DUF3784 domain-containing protein n=1 Tax=Vagococcus vulneris TaxID=1977869 RepID=A0A430A077_9ENTE|nr:hypothetical protein [Vagococcus vulneris]RST99740.1 hypothetical protein CBF37_03165 [Vagococcus vulneris]
MIQLLILILALCLLGIGWYMKRHQHDLLILFTQSNTKTIKAFYQTFFTLGIIGIPLGIFITSRIISLIYVIIILVISAVFGINLAKNWK